MKKHMKFTSMLLALALTVAVLPIAAFATEGKNSTVLVSQNGGQFIYLKHDRDGGFRVIKQDDVSPQMDNGANEDIVVAEKTDDIEILKVSDDIYLTQSNDDIYFPAQRIELYTGSDYNLNESIFESNNISAERRERIQNIILQQASIGNENLTVEMYTPLSVQASGYQPDSQWTDSCIY